jgi:hypothetical protein
LRGNVAKWTLHAEFQRGIHRLIGIVEDFPSHRDQIGLPVAQDLRGLVAMDDGPTAMVMISAWRLTCSDSGTC